METTIMGLYWSYITNMCVGVLKDPFLMLFKLLGNVLLWVAGRLEPQEGLSLTRG